MEGQRRSAQTPVEDIRQGGAANAQHTERPRAASVVGMPLPAADRPQPELYAPPQRQMHGQQQPVQPRQIRDPAGLETEPAALAVLVGGLGVRNDVGIVMALDVRYAIAIMSRGLPDAAAAVPTLADVSCWVWDELAAST